MHELTEAMRRFSEERDWTQFHDPKSLTLALMGGTAARDLDTTWIAASS